MKRSVVPGTNYSLEARNNPSIELFQILGGTGLPSFEEKRGGEKKKKKRERDRERNKKNDHRPEP
jgi:hypothetical protein